MILGEWPNRWGELTMLRLQKWGDTTRTLRTGLVLASIILLLLTNALFWFAYSDRTVALVFSLLVIILLMALTVFYKIRIAKAIDKSPLLLVALIFSGLLYMGVFTPFTVPDEVYHFEATYCLSNALMGKGYQDDPLEMRAEDAALIDELSPTLMASNYDAVRNGLNEVYVSGEVVKVDTGSSFDLGSNPPQVRIAAAIGISLARLFGLGSYYLVYIGRIFNLIFFICLAYLSYRITPVGKNVFAVVMLLPMTQHLAASYSYDAGILALSFLLTALIMRAVYRKDLLLAKESAEILITALLLAPCKVIYSFIALAVLLVPSSRFRSRGQGICIKIGCLLIIVLAVLATRLAGIVAVSGAGPDASGTLDFRGEESGYFYTVGDVISSPIKFVIMFFRTIDELGSFYLLTMVGSSLGWFQAEIEMPSFLSIALIVLLLISMVRADDDSIVLPSSLRGTGILVFCIGSAAAMASMLFGWTFNTEQLIMGVQGRYFLPFLPFLLLGLRPYAIVLKSHMNVILIASVSLINIINLTRVFAIALVL